MRTSTWSSRGGAWHCQYARHATSSSRRTRLRGGLVSVASRWTTAALAAGCPLGRSRHSARSSENEVKFAITGLPDVAARSSKHPPAGPTARGGQERTMEIPSAGNDWQAWLGGQFAELQSAILFLTRLPFRRGKDATGG